MVRRTILITGYGFIAKHLLSSLLRVGYCDIIIVSRSAKKDFIDSPHVTNIVCNILELSKLRGVLVDANIDYIFHLASQSVVDQAVVNPISTLKTNVEGTWNILELAKEKKVNGVVLASSMNVYEGNKKQPLSEKDDISLVSPYGYSKYMAETAAKHYSLAYEIPITIVRLGMVFGGGDVNPSRLIPSIINGIICNNQHINLKSPRTTVVDLIYVKDVVQILLKLMQAFEEKNIKYEVFNCSSNSRQKIEDIVNLLVEISSSKECKVHYGDKLHVVRLLDNSKLNAFVQFEGRVPIELALIETYNWYKSNSL